MKRTAVIATVILSSLLSYFVVDALIVDPPETTAPETERFPIVTRFDIARDYGYFIGDEIPLTLIIETSQNVVLDLVNLPHQGDQHGLFEVRDFTLTTSTSAHGGTTYRAAYSLQYFGAAPLTTQFEPLEILYAPTADQASATHVYTYKSLFTQPLTINISRIGPYQPTEALDPKGPISDTRSALVWLSCLLGVAFVFLSVGGWSKAWLDHRRQQNTSELAPPTAAAEALQALRQPAGQFAFLSESTPSPSVRLGHIMREYLQAECSVSAFALTPSELVSRVNGAPHAQTLLGLLQQCDAFTYGATAADQEEERLLWAKTLALFEQLDNEGSS